MFSFHYQINMHYGHESYSVRIVKMWVFFNIRSPFFFYHFTRLKMYRKPWWIELEKQRKLVGPTQVVLQVSTHRHLIDYLSRRTTISQLSLKLTYYNCRWLKSIIQSKYVIRWLNTIAWLWNIKYLIYTF